MWHVTISQNFLFFYSLPLDLSPSESQRVMPSQMNQAVIGGDRAIEYDYTDYDMYAYDDAETEKLKKEHQLQLELQSILDQMNSMNTSTTTETPLPTAVSPISLDNKLALERELFWNVKTKKINAMVSKWFFPPFHFHEIFLSVSLNFVPPRFHEIFRTLKTE